MRAVGRVAGRVHVRRGQHGDGSCAVRLRLRDGLVNDHVTVGAVVTVVGVGWVVG